MTSRKEMFQVIRDALVACNEGSEHGDGCAYWPIAVARFPMSGYEREALSACNCFLKNIKPALDALDQLEKSDD